MRPARNVYLSLGREHNGNSPARTVYLSLGREHNGSSPAGTVYLSLGREHNGSSPVRTVYLSLGWEPQVISPPHPEPRRGDICHIGKLYGLCHPQGVCILFIRLTWGSATLHPRLRYAVLTGLGESLQDLVNHL